MISSNPVCFRVHTGPIWHFSGSQRYSTVTLLARFLGLSTSQPRATAMQ